MNNFQGLEVNSVYGQCLGPEMHQQTAIVQLCAAMCQPCMCQATGLRLHTCKLCTKGPTRASDEPACPVLYSVTHRSSA
jgi:hypothetical protein